MEIVYMLQEVGDGRWSLDIWLLGGCVMGGLWQGSWIFGKVGEDAHHLQVIRGVKLKVVKLERMHGRKRCDGKEEKHQKGSRETKEGHEQTQRGREGRAQTLHVLS